MAPRILHIDDDEGLARLVGKAMARLGYAYENVATGEEGLARIEGGGVDVVVLDHYLPVGTGFAVLTGMAGLPERPPVVYVTGSSEARIAVDALKAGAADYVLKTVGDEFFVLLTSAIDQAIEKARLEREKARADEDVRAARDKAEILLAEVHHRVANSLALVAALVRMQASAVSDPVAKDALTETQARISAIAGLHRRLYTSDDVRSIDLEEYLRTLVAELEGSMRHAGHTARVALDLESVTVPTDKAVPIGMIVTELLTNAFKYAYPNNGSGEVRVIVRRSGEDGATVIVEDDGIGWNGTGKAKGTGLGSRIVHAMANTLESQIDYRGGEGGTRASFTLGHRDPKPAARD